MCPRDVVSSLGSLLLSSVIFGTFLGPTITLILGSQTKRLVQERLVRLVIPSYIVANKVVATDNVISDLVFLMEEPLFLGMCVPAMLPLVCVSIATSSVAVNVMISHCGVESTGHNSIRHIDVTLITAAILGYALVVWFFISCGLHGSWLVVFGAPFCALG